MSHESAIASFVLGVMAVPLGAIAGSYFEKGNRRVGWALSVASASFAAPAFVRLWISAVLG